MGRTSDVDRKVEGDFYAAQKLPLLLRAREQSDAKNCRHFPRDQMSAQKAKWTWHGRANICTVYTEGDFTCQSFSWALPPHLAMSLSQVQPKSCPFPFPFSPSFHFTSLLQKATPIHTLDDQLAHIYCTHNCKTRASNTS